MRSQGSPSFGTPQACALGSMAERSAPRSLPRFRSYGAGAILSGDLRSGLLRGFLPRPWSAIPAQAPARVRCRRHGCGREPVGGASGTPKHMTNSQAGRPAGSGLLRGWRIRLESSRSCRPVLLRTRAGFRDLTDPGLRGISQRLHRAGTKLAREGQTVIAFESLKRSARARPHGSVCFGQPISELDEHHLGGFDTRCYVTRR
jgi:hypothetical protein